MPFLKKAFAKAGILALRLKPALRVSRRESTRPGFFPQRILYFEFTRAGDLICTTPFLALLRKTWPAARITLVVYREVAEVALGLPEVDRVVTLDRSKLGKSVKRLWSMRHAPDTLVLSHSINPLVAFYFWVTDAAAFAGYLWSHAFAGLAGQGLTMGEVEHPSGHLVEQRLDIARALGLPADTAPAVHYSVPEDRVGETVKTALDVFQEGRRNGRKVVALVPGSRSPNRQWPVGSFEALGCRLLRRPEVDVVVLGKPEDGAPVAAMARTHPDRTFDATGRTSFSEFAALIAVSDVVVCNDSAALHVAAALGVPCVGLFGPVPAELRMHHIDGYRSVGLTGTDSCECGYDFFSERKCPYGHRCLVSLAPERVAEAVEGLLDSR